MTAWPYLVLQERELWGFEELQQKLGESPEMKIKNGNDYIYKLFIYKLFIRVTEKEEKTKRANTFSILWVTPQKALMTKESRS